LRTLKGLKALELLVIADPHPTTWASLAVQAGRKDDCNGASRSSSRSLNRRTARIDDDHIGPLHFGAFNQML
jgi:hypothetical protein